MLVSWCLMFNLLYYQSTDVRLANLLLQKSSAILEEVHCVNIYFFCLFDRFCFDVYEWL